MTASSTQHAASGPKSSESVTAGLDRSHGRVHWSDLQAHAERGVLFLFGGTETLVAVATAVAQDSADQVRAWQRAGELRQPTPEELGNWQKQPRKLFESVVVQPFVLTRELPE